MNDASTKIKSTDFIASNKFILGVPISAACKTSYNEIAYISYSSWIYCISFYRNIDGNADYEYCDRACIVYYI